MRSRPALIAALPATAILTITALIASPALADPTLDPAGQAPTLTAAAYPDTALTAGQSTTPTLNSSADPITGWTGCITETLDGTTLTTTDVTDTTLTPADYTRTYDDIYNLTGATRHSTYTLNFYEHTACTDIAGQTPITAMLTLGYPTENTLTSVRYTLTDISVGETSVMELNLAGGSQQVEHWTGCVTETLDSNAPATSTDYTDETLYSASFDRTYRTITALTGAQPDSLYTLNFYEHIPCTDIAGETPTQSATIQLVPPTVITSLAWSDPTISSGDESHLVVNGTDTTWRGWTGCTAPYRIHNGTRHNWYTSDYTNQYAWTAPTEFTVTYQEILYSGLSDGDTFVWAIYPDTPCDQIDGKTPITAAFTFDKNPADNKTPTLSFSPEYLPNADDETLLTIEGYSGHVFTVTDGTECSTAYRFQDMSISLTADSFPDADTLTISVYDYLAGEWGYLHPDGTCADLTTDTPLATATVHFGSSAPETPQPPATPDNTSNPDTANSNHPTRLQNTGANITAPLTAGTLLLTVGITLLLLTRRRRTQ